MSEQKKKAAPETEKVETPKIPHVAYPLKPRSNTTNLSQQYFNHLAGDESARFLFNNSGLWHQGIHLRASKFPSSEFENNNICAIADGKLIAYKVDSEYKSDNESESSKESAVYSTGFFLLKHEVAYPKDNVLTFYSLYRHTAKLSDYKSGIEEIVGSTKSSDNKIVIRDAQNQPLNPRVELKNGVTIGVKRHTQTQDKFDELLWYRETKDNKTVEHKPKSGEHWRIFHQSYEEMQSEQIKGLPLLSKHKIDTQADIEVKLDKPIEIKAGEELGLMGEYNQIGESGEKLLHLEVFTYDNIEQFKAKAEAAYKQDREKKGIKDNFLYVARGSQLYSVLKDEVVELEKSKVEIMVPLADVAKQTVKKKTDKVGKDYYNVQPYLYSLPHKHQEGGIYVDERHLTHGLLFPGVNIFNQSGNGLCIFKHPLHQNIDPKSDLTTEQKNELDPMFKLIMDELDLEKDKNAAVSFEAGKLKDLLLSPVQQRRLTGIVAKHDSEWKKTRAADFSQTCGVYRANGKEDTAKRIEKRVEDLSIKLEVDGFNTDKQAYYLHPLGMIGWLAVSVGEFDWFETPLVKLIVSKESKGSFNAYNITGWDEKNRNRVYESHFEPTAQYHLEKMTIAEIRKAQTTEIGPNRKHLFAIGIFQMIPSTIFGKRKGDKCFMKWLSNYRNVNESEQLFNREFQQLTPLYFWEDKQEEISLYFMDKTTVEEAAYAVSKEWASAAVPKNKSTYKGKFISNGYMSYYAGDGMNNAHYSADVTINALKETKKIIDNFGGYSLVREVTLSILNK
jgi:glycoside hydrolase, family 19, putative